MRIQSKLDKIEKLLNMKDKDKEIKLMIIIHDLDYVGEGYFKNQEEKRLFVDWYVDKLYQRQRYNKIEFDGAFIYKSSIDENRRGTCIIDGAVVEGNLDAFRKYLLKI